MRRSLLGVAAFALGLSVAATSAQAQETTTTTTRPVRFGVSAGLSIPTGDFGDVVNTGFNLNGLVEGKLTTVPIALRGEFTFDHFGFDESALGFGGSERVLAGVANALYYFPVSVNGNVIRPYVIGGAGIYNGKFNFDDAPDPGSDTNFGLNGGAGIELPLTGIAVFLEARLHYVFSDNGDNGLGYNAGFVPLVVGLRF
jgi:hypothetical protein